MPVVASFSDLAASGGYYMAMGADTILSDDATITGSIGVLGGKFNVKGLYDKLGINVETLAQGRQLAVDVVGARLLAGRARALRG